MNIAYDGSSLSIAPLTGVGNYTFQLLAHLQQADGEHTYHVLSHRAFVDGLGLIGFQRTRRVPAHFPNRLLWMQCVLPLVLRALQPSLAHFPNFVAPLASEQRMVLTIHDLGLLHSPHLFTRRQRLLMRPFIEPSAQRARAIIVMSEQTKRDLGRMQIDPAKVYCVHEAAAPLFGEPVSATEIERRLAAYRWERAARHILFVGTLEPRKNLLRLVAALHRLHERGIHAHLWLVGQPSRHGVELAQEVERSDLGAFVHQTGYVPNVDLRAFYHACDVFVMPSLLEGFGLPVVEAMVCGAPVVVSDTATLREVADDAALYFHPLNTDALTETLARVLCDGGLAEALRHQGRARAAHFSWACTARETLAVYQRVVQPQPPTLRREEVRD